MKIGNTDQKNKANNYENLALGEDQFEEDPHRRASAIDKLISIDQIFITFTIRDLGEGGIEVLFYSGEKVASTMVWSKPVEKPLKSQRMEKSKALPVDAINLDT